MERRTEVDRSLMDFDKRETGRLEDVYIMKGVSGHFLVEGKFKGCSKWNSGQVSGRKKMVKMGEKDMCFCGMRYMSGWNGCEER